MNRNTSAMQTRRRHAAFGRTFACAGVALGISVAWASDARAATYRVYTATAASSMTVANDSNCTLAEAVLHVNGKNNGITYCTDFAPGSSTRIELMESSGKSFANNHFKINDKLTFTSSVFVAGRGAFIDSTSKTSAFVLGAKGASSQPTVFFDRTTLTNTAGTGGGRLIENYGTLRMRSVVITKGNVTQHQNGVGGGIYNAGLIDSAVQVTLKENEAKKGGGLYNDAGTITELASSWISNNKATLAGGGIYNAVTGPTAAGSIKTRQLTITGNTAITGGGIFNRGVVELNDSSVTLNTAKWIAGTSSGEQCTGISCDGMGGGVLSVHPYINNVNLSAVQTRINLTAASIVSDNEASHRGGAISSAGNLELNATISANKAPIGAAVYVVSPTDGTSEYCNFTGDEVYGSTVIYDNEAAYGYSIVAGSLSPSHRCTFRPGYVFAFGNTAPYCHPDVLRTGDPDHPCPQQ